MAKDLYLKEVFKNGDFNVAFSDEQHIEHVMLSSPGHFKSNPLIGVSILNAMNAPWSPKTRADLERTIRLNLEADGAKNITINSVGSTKTINVNGTY